MGFKARGERIAVENVNVPGQLTNVDPAKYLDMKRALLAVLPTARPGLTQDEMFAAVIPQVSTELFPGGAKTGWWVKCVHLDLEAKGAMTRDGGKPLRWRLTS